MGEGAGASGTGVSSVETPGPRSQISHSEGVYHLQKFFAPASVVLIGVSRRTGAGAYNNLEMLLGGGLAPGRVSFER